MSLKYKLKNLFIEDFVNYSIEDLFSIQSEALELNIRNVYLDIKKLLKSILINKFDYILDANNSDNEILFLYSHYFYRKDHFNTFINFTKGLNLGEALYPIVIQNSFKIKDTVNRFYKCNLWLKSLQRRGLNLHEKVIVLQTLLEAYKFMREINKINLEKYRMLVVYFDVNPIENLLVQHFKNQGKLTMTLQHGSFVAKRDDCINLEGRGIELNNSISNYFLAWNHFTKEEAIKAGLSHDKIKVLGIPKYLNMEVEVNKGMNYNDRLFGLILGTKESQKQNIELIKIANRISNKMNLKYKIKYHPSFQGNEYNKYIDKKCYEGNYDKYLTIKEYSKQVNFSLVGNSSVYIELVFLNHLTYRIIGIGDFDKFENIKENTFTSSLELEELLLTKETENRKLFQYLCTTKDIDDSYLDFFESIKT